MSSKGMSLQMYNTKLLEVVKTGISLPKYLSKGVPQAIVGNGETYFFSVKMEISLKMASFWSILDGISCNLRPPKLKSRDIWNRPGK